jgi:hypothetical protein
MQVGRTKPSLAAADRSLVGATSSIIGRTIRTLPHGQALSDEVWERRHRGIVMLLWLHGPPLAIFGIALGVPAEHSLMEGSVIAVLALLAGQALGSRRLRAAVAVVGLVTSSAVLIHLSGGVIEAHFHFFVVLASSRSTRTGCRSASPSATSSCITACGILYPTSGLQPQ